MRMVSQRGVQKGFSLSVHSHGEHVSPLLVGWHATWLESFDQIFTILAIFVVQSEEEEVNHGLHGLYGF